MRKPTQKIAPADRSKRGPAKGTELDEACVAAAELLDTIAEEVSMISSRTLRISTAVRAACQSADGSATRASRSTLAASMSSALVQLASAYELVKSIGAAGVVDLESLPQTTAAANFAFVKPARSGDNDGQPGV